MVCDVVTVSSITYAEAPRPIDSERKYMNNRYISLALFFSVLLTFQYPTSANATACDTGTGWRREVVRPLVDAPVDLAEFKFLRANFSDGDAGTEGLAEEFGWTEGGFALKFNRDGEKLIFSFEDIGKVGSITFTLPSKYTAFEVDTQETTHEHKGFGPNVYVEWRFNGTVQLDGAFAAVTRKSKAELVLQGLGNACRSSEDFHAWTLIVRGNGAQFTLVGRFKRLRDETPQE